MSGPESGDVRVVISASDSLMRSGLAAILSAASLAQVVGIVPIGPEAESVLESASPDVLLLDTGWDSGSVIELIRYATDRAIPAIAFVDDRTQTEPLADEGVAGLLLRAADADQIAAAITAVANGLEVFDSSLTTIARQRVSASSLSKPELSPREIQVLKLLSDGSANKEIAYNLGISENTVKFHVTSIMRKLDARSRTEAVLAALKLGMIYL